MLVDAGIMKSWLIAIMCATFVAAPSAGKKGKSKSDSDRPRVRW